MPPRAPAVEHFVFHGVSVLATRGSTEQKPAVATRVWVHALQSMTTAAQWARLLPIVKVSGGRGGGCRGWRRCARRRHG